MKKIYAGTTARSLVFNDQGQMLIVKRSSTDQFHAGAWDLPGGRVEHGEDITAAVQRETQEEVGIGLGSPVLIFATSDMREGTTKTWVFFTQEVAPQWDSIELSHEHDEYKWISPSELNSYTDYEILLRLYRYYTTNNLFI
ncbi:MAG TPA: NUDIX hydrolase [Candidatus Saccharimonadales bacterium]|nr:NUDIX hydrolase [Candidatus Saccharimonadales bacterium]